MGFRNNYRNIIIGAQRLSAQKSREVMQLVASPNVIVDLVNSVNNDCHILWAPPGVTAMAEPPWFGSAVINNIILLFREVHDRRLSRKFDKSHFLDKMSKLSKRAFLPARP